MRASREGAFTIVELLIVIVIIAILASITVVAFNGAQNRAADSAVQSDLQKLAKLIVLYQVDNGFFPVGGGGSGNRVLAVTFPAARSAYDPNTINLYYCEGQKSGASTFSIVGRSKSTTTYKYTPENGIINAGGGSIPAICYNGYDGGVYTMTQGYHSNPAIGWAGWTQ